ncbi:MAG: hypothetical protein KUG74_03365 [Rhodobacteraceae bacterium]|nr:hypothetical protein [Paracoccaceae bacterium]
MMSQPSYNQLLLARTALWNGFNKARNLPEPVLREFEALKRINKKDLGYTFAAQNGVECVNFHVYDSVADAMAGFLPRSFVIKPLHGHSSYGVYLLKKRPNGSFFCKMHNKVYKTRAAVVQDYQRRLSRSKNFTMSEAVILEEYVRDSFGFDVPLDYKVYGFQGGSPIVMQRYAPMHLPKEKWAFEFYDAKGQPLGLIRERIKSNPEIILQAPKNFDALIKASDHLIQASRVSFMRVDLYAAPKRIIFGEFTPVPNAGKETYVPEFDRLLGQYWADSLETLGIDYSAYLPS